MGRSQALLMPSATGAWDKGAVTMDHNLMLSVGQNGLFNVSGEDFYEDATDGTLSKAELAQCKYIFAPQAQQILASVRTGDWTKWEALKTRYGTLGLPTPARLVPFRSDLFRWTSDGVETFTHLNIYSSGPSWGLDAIVTPPGDVISLPPSTAVDPGYQSTQSGLSFDAAKTILDDDGWTWSNFTDSPFGTSDSPYSFQKPGAKQFRILHTLMKISDSDWADAITAFLVSGLGDSSLELDGVLGYFTKVASYYPGYRLGTGRGPGYPSLDDPNSNGIASYLLEYWTRTRSGGPGEIGYPWFTATDTPAYPVSGDHDFDLPSESILDYVDGHILQAQTLRTEIDANTPGKELWWQLCPLGETTGLWQSGGPSFRRWWRDEYIAAEGGTTEQQAQEALLAKIVEIADVCDGLIMPVAAETGADPNDANCTAIETAGWFEALARGKKIIYAN